MLTISTATGEVTPFGGGNAMTTFADALRAWKDWMPFGTTLRRATQIAVHNNVGQLMRHLTQHLGREALLSDISGPALLFYLTGKRRDGWSGPTYNKAIFAFRVFATFLPMYAPEVDAGPLLVIPRLKGAKSGTRRVPTIEDSLAFVRGAERNPHRFLMRMELALVLTYLCTGMRSGEVRTLRWKSIAGGHVHIGADVAKNGQARSIPICEDLADALARYREACELTGRSVEDDSPVWQPYKGQQLGEQALTKRRREILIRAGREDMIEWCDWHCLRHAFVTRLLGEGVPLSVVMAMVGHKWIGTTSRYRHAPETAVIEEWAESCAVPKLG